MSSWAYRNKKVIENENEVIKTGAWLSLRYLPAVWFNWCKEANRKYIDLKVYF